MSTPVCDWCAGWIEVNTRRHPGFCSPACRDEHRLYRDYSASERARLRADARQHRATQ